MVNTKAIRELVEALVHLDGKRFSLKDYYELGNLGDHWTLWDHGFPALDFSLGVSNLSDSQIEEKCWVFFGSLASAEKVFNIESVARHAVASYQGRVEKERLAQEIDDQGI